MKHLESAIIKHESTIKLSNNNSRIIYSSSNTREKPRNVKSNSDLNKYSRTVNGNNVFTSEICESHGRNRDIPRSDATQVALRTSALWKEDSSQLGSTRLWDSDSANPNSLDSGSDSAELCSPSALNSPTVALLAPDETLCRKGGREEKREVGKILDPELEGLELLL